MGTGQDDSNLKEFAKGAWYRVGRWLCRVFCLLFFQTRIHGIENVPKNGPFILVSNHQSYLDPIFCGVGLHRRLCYVARDSLFRNKFFAALISSVNAIPVKRGEADLHAMRQIMRKLKRGFGVCLFPEATRTEDGSIRDFKAGFGLLSKKTNATIIPVLLDGAYECWPKGRKIWSRGQIWICYGSPISPEQAREMGDKELAKVVTERIRRMQRYWRSKRGLDTVEY